MSSDHRGRSGIGFTCRAELVRSAAWPSWSDHQQVIWLGASCVAYLKRQSTAVVVVAYRTDEQQHLHLI